MNISPVRHTELQVSPYESLNLQTLGRLVGTSQNRTLKAGPHTHHRWAVPVQSLPAGLQATVAQHPVLSKADTVFVNYPAGVHGISQIGFLNYVEGGVIPNNLAPFFAEGRTIVSTSERSAVVQMLRDAGLLAHAGHVAFGGNVFDYGRAPSPAAPCTTPAEAAKVIGGELTAQAPVQDAAQRGRATQSMLAMRAQQAR